MRIQKSKHIRIQITVLASFGVVFAFALCYFLGWNFEIKSFAIAIGILITLLFALWLLCFLLIKFEKKYYVIEKDRITLWTKNTMLFELKSSFITEINYISFMKAFLLQLGSGYLNIYSPIEALTDKKYASIIMFEKTAIFSISMSKKQAKMVAGILNKEVKMK